MESEIQRKIEETVREILSNADLEETTEFKVRVAASERLGLDLSDPHRRSLVRNAVETFLLSQLETKLQDEPDSELRKEASDSSGRVICKLSDKRKVVVHDFRGKTLVSIREFYQKDGKQLPSSRGISLSAEQWSFFKQNVPAIEEVIRTMESKLRPEVDAEIDVPHEFRIEIDRFDGKNYKCWEQQMDLLLKQLKVAYVLYEPCPSILHDTEAGIEEISRAKAAEQNWKNDDYICCRNILSSLSDHLFCLYSKKTMTAKELWEELKLLHLCEEYRTKRSQVKKYIEFQIVEERSIVEQVQELNNIADSIGDAGMDIEEKFHVSVVISKLPPSWKDLSIKLMCEEYLPFGMLMNCLGVEEETRNQRKQNVPNPEHKDTPENDGLMVGLPKPYFLHSRKRELHTDSKVCHSCGRKGHIAPQCRSKTWSWRRDRDFAEKKNGDNGSISASAEINPVN